MELSFRKVTMATAIAGVGLLLSASAAWACLSLAGITTNLATVQPGGAVTVSGIGFEFGTNPVVIHLDSIDGAVLGTATLDHIGDFSKVVTLPAAVSGGQHVLVATEAAATADGSNDGSNTGVPARAIIDVGNSTSSTASPARPVTVITNSGTGVGTLIVISLAVAAALVFLAGSMSLVASRRRRGEAESVKAPGPRQTP
ncbi:MAG: hypothetical protein ACRDY0_08400 [Acidimicrobiales bacterium]